MNESTAKYLAGLLDADGSLSFHFKRSETRQDRFYMGLILKLTAADAVDRDRYVEKLPLLTGFGQVHREGKLGQFCNWTVSKRADLEMLLPRLIKHMIIKAQHWQWLLDMWRDLRRMPRTNDGSFSVSEREMEELKEASKHSRRLRVGPLKAKNFPTWAWLAGYLDGDGSYVFRYDKVQNYWSMRVSAVAHINDVSVLEFLQRSFGGSVIDHGQSTGCKVWYRSLGVRDASFALRFLPKLAKHSKLKRYRIDRMIHYHRQRLSDSAPTGEATV